MAHDNKPSDNTNAKRNSPDVAQVPIVEDLDAARDVKDADADRVKGGVKKAVLN